MPTFNLMGFFYISELSKNEYNVLYAAEFSLGWHYISISGNAQDNSLI